MRRCIPQIDHPFRTADSSGCIQDPFDFHLCASYYVPIANCPGRSVFASPRNGTDRTSILDISASFSLLPSCRCVFELLTMWASSVDNGRIFVDRTIFFESNRLPLKFTQTWSDEVSPAILIHRMPERPQCQGKKRKVGCICYNTTLIV